MENLKYELTDISIEHNGSTLHRIKALKSFADVNIGDLGGYVKSERNLAQEGNCWVYGNAKICDDAKVYGNARIRDNAVINHGAKVYGNALVCNNVKVYDLATLHGNALVHGNASIFSRAIVRGDSIIFGDAKVCGYSEVSGDVEICDNAIVRGDAIIDGHAMICNNAVIDNGDSLRHIYLNPYYVTITPSYIKIGCQLHAIDTWKNFDDTTIQEMDDGALEWWKKYKDIVIRLYKLISVKE